MTAGMTAALGCVIAAAAERIKADVCRPGPKSLQYDCTIKLTDARTGAPLTGPIRGFLGAVPVWCIEVEKWPIRLRTGRTGSITGTRTLIRRCPMPPSSQYG